RDKRFVLPLEFALPGFAFARARAAAVLGRFNRRERRTCALDALELSRLAIIDQLITFVASRLDRAGARLLAARFGEQANLGAIAHAALALAAHAAQFAKLRVALLAHAELLHLTGQLGNLHRDRILARLALTFLLGVALSFLRFLPLGIIEIL